MYADTMTPVYATMRSMKRPRRRQVKWPIMKNNGIVTQAIKKEIRDLISVTKAVAKEDRSGSPVQPPKRKELVRNCKANARSRQVAILIGSTDPRYDI